MRPEWSKIEAEGRERGWGSWGRAESRCELPSGVFGGAPTAERFSTIFISALRMASPDTIILLCLIGGGIKRCFCLTSVCLMSV